MRLAVYGGVSTLLAASVILEAFRQRSNFYTACIYLSKSSACTLILLNAGIFISIMLGRLLQAIFFGQLRPIEVEHLYEKSWYAVTETCLAMTIFRDEFDIQFVIVFTTLLFLKIFHWLCQDRMEQTPAVPLNFHVRMVSLMSVLLVIDCRLASRAISTIMVKGPNMMIMFGFEYAILTSSMISTVGKYTLNVIEGRMEEPWESKSIFVFYLDLITDFFKLITYMVFFAIICNFYGLPLHIIRDVYVTFRSFIQKCRDLYRYRRATRNMNELYPDATEEDLRRMSDSTCIICREDMQIIATVADPQAGGPSEPEQPRGRNSDIPKKLPCGHIFHFGCLRSWLERQQSCPTCRRSVLPEAATATAPSPQAPIGQQPQQQGEQPVQPADQQQQQQQQQQHPTPPLNGAWPFIDRRTGNPHIDSAVQQGSGYANMSPPPPPPPPPPFATTLNILQAIAAQNNVARHPSTSQTILGHSQNAGQNLVPLIPLALDSQSRKSAEEQLPEGLTSEQLQALSMNTREAIEERLRILEMVQTQTFRSIQLLSQVLSVLPENSGVPGQYVDSQEGKQNDNSRLLIQVPVTSERKREKMPMDTQLPVSTNEYTYSQQESEIPLNSDNLSTKSEESLVKVENEDANATTGSQSLTAPQNEALSQATYNDNITQNHTDV